MVWFLVASVLFNVLSGFAVALVLYAKITADSEVLHSHQEWQKWEGRFYEMQGKLVDEQGLHVSITKGAYGSMMIEKIE